MPELALDDDAFDGLAAGGVDAEADDRAGSISLLGGALGLVELRMMPIGLGDFVAGVAQAGDFFAEIVGRECPRWRV